MSWEHLKPCHYNILYTNLPQIAFISGKWLQREKWRRWEAEAAALCHHSPESNLQRQWGIWHIMYPNFTSGKYSWRSAPRTQHAYLKIPVLWWTHCIWKHPQCVEVIHDIQAFMTYTLSVAPPKLMLEFVFAFGLRAKTACMKKILAASKAKVCDELHIAFFVHSLASI